MVQRDIGADTSLSDIASLSNTRVVLVSPPLNKRLVDMRLDVKVFSKRSMIFTRRWSG